MNANASPTVGKSLVVVLGAGASKEVDLPIGSELKSGIAAALDIRFAGGYQQSSGDRKIAEALAFLPPGPGDKAGDINPFLRSCWRIRDAMPQATSIDNFIDSHRADVSVAACGKLAIAQCILKAEKGSSLTVDRSNVDNKIKFSEVEGTWFNAFFQLLAENCQAEDLPKRLAKVAIVSFNYDRCVEHYLHQAIQNYYGVDDAAATAAMAALEVHHPYGKVGALPWMDRAKGIEFGDDPHPRRLFEIAGQIRTFTEGVDPSTSDIDAIRATMAGADRVVFLGFAFHPLNLDLLFPVPELDSGVAMARRVFATAAGLSKSDARLIGEELSARLGQVGVAIEVRTDLKCAGLFQEFGRSLSLI